MKVRERRWQESGFGGGRWQVRVRKVTGEQPPKDAEKVPEQIEEHDWRDE